MRHPRRSGAGAVMSDEFDPMAVQGRDPSDGTVTRITVRSEARTAGPNVAADQLRAFVERIERLEEEKKTVADDIKNVYGEAKCMGFDTKILKKVIVLRRMDDAERMEQDLGLDTYLAALGMIPDE